MEKIQLSRRGTGTGMQYDLVCFSHLRWNFVYQRPQHLMSRFAACFRVFFVEEPIFEESADHYRIGLSKENVYVVTPVLKHGGDPLSITRRVRIQVDRLFADNTIRQFVAWYYTPMALKFSSHLKPMATVYDCMDELSAFKFAPAELKLLEAEMFKKASVVFTGGHSLYQAKKKSHHNIYPCPSSIDKHHFMQAREVAQDPADQAAIPPMRLGFYGVIDERFDIKLLEEVAKLRPQWQLVLVGPVVKINEADLPRLENMHYLGGKNYDQLPQYLAGWDIAIIPFEKNESTRFISPTKTPEYLAGGKPVISASINDVVEPYGNNKLVHIADDAATFIKAAEKIFSMSARSKKMWLNKVDGFLDNISWDKTAGHMLDCIQDCIAQQAGTRKSLKSVA
jgi:glycosyltransferase involved in cell wall biosynthesis